jgi:hypothetical protein
MPQIALASFHALKKQHEARLPFRFGRLRRQNSERALNKEQGGGGELVVAAPFLVLTVRTSFWATMLSGGSGEEAGNWVAVFRLKTSVVSVYDQVLASGIYLEDGDGDW